MVVFELHDEKKFLKNYLACDLFGKFFRDVIVSLYGTLYFCTRNDACGLLAKLSCGSRIGAACISNVESCKVLEF